MGKATNRLKVAPRRVAPPKCGIYVEEGSVTEDAEAVRLGCHSEKQLKEGSSPSFS